MGPDAGAGVRRSGEIFALVTDPWDAERVKGDIRTELALALALDLEAALRASCGGEKVAVAGLELMEARFVKALGDEPRSATTAVEKLRMVKLPRELDAVERAAELADSGYAVFADTIEAGMAEYELVAEVEAFLKAEGASDNFMLISSGGAEVRGMKPPTERRFREGDVVATELTPCVDGFYAQICRSLIIGEPSQAQIEAFDIFKKARQAGEDALRPGVNICDVARAENDVFREAGLGEYTTAKYTRVRGHGLGRLRKEVYRASTGDDGMDAHGIATPGWTGGRKRGRRFGDRTGTTRKRESTRWRGRRWPHPSRFALGWTIFAWRSSTSR